MPNVAELIKEHVTLTVDSIDRVYLKGYVPGLYSSGGVVRFLSQRGQRIASPALFGQLTNAFKTGLRAWAEARAIPWIEFKKGERKDDVVQPYRARFTREAGVVLIGVAQERAKAWRGVKRSATGTSPSTTSGPRTAGTTTMSTSSMRRGDRVSSRSVATRRTP